MTGALNACPGIGFAAAAIVAVSAWVFGESTLKLLGLGKAERRPALATTLGLGVLAQALFFAGLVGAFQAHYLLFLFAAAHLLCIGTWRQLYREVSDSRPWRRWREKRSWITALILAPIIFLALYPPTGWDETAYHLPYVRAFMEAGGLVFAEALRYPVFPQIAELLFLAASHLGGDIAAALTQTLALVLGAALLSSWGTRTFSPRVGLWAAALWLGTPLAIWLGTMAYVDILLTLFIIAAFSCWQRWRDEGGWRFLVLAGAFVGLAASTKYLGLFFCGVLGVLTLGRSIRKRTLGPAILITVVATATLLPWYARIYEQTGNPVFPFYAPFFGESEWTTKHDKLLFEENRDGEPGENSAARAETQHFTDGLSKLARLPYSAVFDRGQFSNMAPISPWYLLLLPLGLPLLLTLRGPPGAAARRLGACFLAYAFFWLGLEHDLRFLLPGLPLLNMALLAGLENAGRWLRHPRHAGIFAALLLAPGWLYAQHKIWEKGPLPRHDLSRADFLEEKVPGYGGIRYLNERHGEDYVVMALFAGRLRHYARGHLYGDAWGPDGYDKIRQALRSGTLEGELQRRGARYFLVDRQFLRQPMGASFERRFQPVWEGGSFTLYELSAQSM